MRNEYLKSIAYKLTGLELKIHNNYKKTCFKATAIKGIYKLGYIIFSKKYINSVFNIGEFNDLKNRGYNKKYIYLQVLLHEIAHYKQCKKIGYKKFSEEYYFNINYFENQADRYALRYYKNLI